MRFRGGEGRDGMECPIGPIELLKTSGVGGTGRDWLARRPRGQATQHLSASVPLVWARDAVGRVMRNRDRNSAPAWWRARYGSRTAFRLGHPHPRIEYGPGSDLPPPSPRKGEGTSGQALPLQLAGGRDVRVTGYRAESHPGRGRRQTAGWDKQARNLCPVSFLLTYLLRIRIVACRLAGGSVVCDEGSVARMCWLVNRGWRVDTPTASA